MYRVRVRIVGIRAKLQKEVIRCGANKVLEYGIDDLYHWYNRQNKRWGAVY